MHRELVSQPSLPQVTQISSCLLRHQNPSIASNISYSHHLLACPYLCPHFPPSIVSSTSSKAMPETNIHWRDVDSLVSSGRSHESLSDGSYRSRRQTPPTPQTHDRDARPEIHHHRTCYPRVENHQHADARASVETYASTDDDEEEEDEDQEILEDDDYPPYEVPEYRQEVSPCDAIPATPKDFAELFPSPNRLCIRHDDTTLDGNMNLRIDTRVETRHSKQLVTLFHLRMHDLKNRDFSLRRYCRDSGREVCHSIRKYQKPPSERPALQRSFSSAIATFRHKPERNNSATVSLKRQDSGYGSISADKEDPNSKSAVQPKRAQVIPTNTMKLEFSNYAHVDIKRRGSASHKRYEFEYWGVNYSWKRVMKRDGDFCEISYHLLRGGSDQALAHIVPVPLTTSQAREEAAKGGWIPPCSMWLSDGSVTGGVSDLADVVVATGLMTLVDDSIKNHFHSKQSTRIHVPLKGGPFRLNMDYVGPKRLIDEVFHRTTRGSSGRGLKPLRRASVAA
ncbi:hypothetical protein IWX92DRAFT_372275 [Phyllosticta citricarpa]